MNITDIQIFILYVVTSPPIAIYVGASTKRTKKFPYYQKAIRFMIDTKIVGPLFLVSEHAEPGRCVLIKSCFGLAFMCPVSMLSCTVVAFKLLVSVHIVHFARHILICSKMTKRLVVIFKFKLFKDTACF